MKNYFNKQIMHYQRLEKIAETLPNVPWDEIVRVWIEGGLLSPDYSGDVLESWLNVCSHSATAALLASELGKLLNQLGYIVSETDVTVAMLLHDWNKKLEVAETKKSQNIPSISKFNQSASKKIAKIFTGKIANLTLCTGDIGYQTFVDKGLSLEEHIVFYADICTNGDRVVGYQNRFNEIYKHFVLGGRYAHTEQFFIDCYGKSWRDCNLEVINSFESFFLLKNYPVNSMLSQSLVPSWCY
ncbi:hypothetical protein MCEMOHM34_00946 [Candidatus Methylopumilus universalis]|uniref:hypothetical protein n=1 Tax=Candidatus Methylopumilus universalis TaxID=2588536 RepID=UPI003BEEDF1B